MANSSKAGKIDIAKLISQFAEGQSLEFPAFRDIWAKMGFSYIEHARRQNEAVNDFYETLFVWFLEYFHKPHSSWVWKCGALYGTYMLYETQLPNARCKIPITVDTFHAIMNLCEEAVTKAISSPGIIWEHLRKTGAINLTAAGRINTAFVKVRFKNLPIGNIGEQGTTKPLVSLPASILSIDRLGHLDDLDAIDNIHSKYTDARQKVERLELETINELHLINDDLVDSISNIIADAKNGRESRDAWTLPQANAFSMQDDFVGRSDIPTTTTTTADERPRRNLQPDTSVHRQLQYLADRPQGRIRPEESDTDGAIQIPVTVAASQDGMQHMPIVGERSSRITSHTLEMPPPPPPPPKAPEQSISAPANNTIPNISESVPSLRVPVSKPVDKRKPKKKPLSAEEKKKKRNEQARESRRKKRLLELQDQDKAETHLAGEAIRAALNINDGEKTAEEDKPDQVVRRSSRRRG